MGECRDLNPEMLSGLHSLKHGRFVPRSMMEGLVHFGYAVKREPVVDQFEFEITEAGRAHLECAGICRKVC